MHRFALMVLVATSLIFSLSAQVLTLKEKALLLPKEQNVSGIVVDSSGHPIKGASIENTDLQRKIVTTDESGRFRITTQAPAFVVRKRGYDGAFLRTVNAKSVRITLRVSKNVVPSCVKESSCKAIVGFGGFFCFAEAEGIEVTEQGNDVDYGQRFFSVQTKDGVASIWHGAGSSWDWGVPSNEDVWLSIDYSERESMVAGYTVIDARGRTADGKFWRYIGRLGESASYRDLDRESATLLDKVLDSMCALREKNR